MYMVVTAVRAECETRPLTMHGMALVSAQNNPDVYGHAEATSACVGVSG